jgi:DNA-binding transcriptional regulator YiaG
MAAKSKKAFVPAKDFLARFSADDRAAIEARAQALISEELTLRDLRKAMALTQVQLSSTLGVGQEQVSRMEQRSDLLLSTLASYVDAMGGKLRLLVEFPDRPPVALSNLGDVAKPKAPARKAKRKKAA